MNYRVCVAESVAVISLCLVIRVKAEITKCGVAQQSAGVCFAGGSRMVCGLGKPTWTRLQLELDSVSIQDSKNKVKVQMSSESASYPLVALDNSWEMMRTLLGDTSRRSLALAALSEPDYSGDPTAAVLLRLQMNQFHVPGSWRGEAKEARRECGFRARQAGQVYQWRAGCHWQMKAQSTPKS